MFSLPYYTNCSFCREMTFKVIVFICLYDITLQVIHQTQFDQWEEFRLYTIVCQRRKYAGNTPFYTPYIIF